MSDLEFLIDRAIALKSGDKEFALFGNVGSDGHWRAEIGNPSSSVMLGEIEGEFRGEGPTMKAAVEALIAKIS